MLKWLLSFLIWWGVLLSVSISDPYGLNPVSHDTYIVIVGFVLSYAIGFAIHATGAKSYLRVCAIDAFGIVNELKKSKINFILETFCIFVLAAYCLEYFQYLNESGAGSSRSARFDVGLIFKSTFEAAIFEYTIGAILWVNILIASLGAVRSDARSLLWVLSLLYCVLYISFGGSRFTIAEICIFTIFLINSLGSKSSKLKSILSVAILSYILTLYSTYIRLIDDSFSVNALLEANDALLEQVVVYMVGSIRALDHFINTNGSQPFSSGLAELTFGWAYEMASHLQTLLRIDLIGVSKWGEYVAIPIDIGNGNGFNALYTAIFNFYVDFSWIGVVVFAFLFGLVSSFSLNRFYLRGTIIWLLISGMLYVSAMLSNFFWLWSVGPPVLSMVYLNFVATNKSYVIR